MTATRDTVIVNLFAGPGAGKSTLAAGLFYRLKLMGVECDLATEYAKTVIWMDAQALFHNQVYIFAKQHERVFQAFGKVDVIVTDSPILLSWVYNGSPALCRLALDEHRRARTLNYVIQRVKPYSTVGRLQDAEEATRLDRRIIRVLHDNHISYTPIPGTPLGIDRVMWDLQGEIE